jgi:hypothetical protein
MKDDNKAMKEVLMMAEAGCGGVVFFGEPSGVKIEEIVDCELRTAKWRDIVCESGWVVEIDAGDKARIWRKIKEEDLTENTIFGDDTIKFRGETLHIQETGRPQVGDQDRFDYAVYVGDAGTAVCLENWPDRPLEVYLLEKEIDLWEINIIYH